MNAPFAVPETPDVEIAIIGAGLSGLGMAIRLQQEGRGSFVILEQTDDVGGTWRDNTYPGCACDVPSHLYSYSFELNPNWSRMFAPQDEIWDYIRHCVKKYGLAPKIRFNTQVVRAEWDDRALLWRLHSEGGEVVTARSVVAGLGPLNRPNFPNIKGIESFTGRSFHSSWWEHDYDLTGKRVGVIGTGASSIQFVPQIAPQVNQLHLFQRTPPWILPKPDGPMSGFARWLFRVAPFFQRLFRNYIYWMMESRAFGFTINPRMMKLIERMARKHIKKTIPDPELRAKVTPDYLIGCKRILIANDYYPALLRDNVELVTDTIAEIRPRSIVTADGTEREVDAIIYGTGFHAAEMQGSHMFTGRGGRSLHDDWQRGPEAYLGITVSGFPNLFFLVGPNTGLGHNSIIYMIEAQVAYILDCLTLMDREGLAFIDVRPEVQSAYNAKLQDKMDHTVWSSGCKSWYQTEDGRNTTLWPGFTFTYRKRTAHVTPSDYERVKAPEALPTAAE